ncbi:Ribosomal protein L50, mitochondria [Moelleriella libera RCEF 2490]|uniref:Large ribosomal subunit protein mL50 n=1 Tax=Moelleriella libera RCEF 2490 TaxID=1081109 RepID=A0A168F2X1_9HYPO|nr:Ribosomal protein L50, mitochondria [Moelleriella libera RCEF 2490]
MSRLPRMRRLTSLSAAAIPTATPSSLSSSLHRAPLAARRAISSTCASRGKNTDWVRGKLWKGEAPGPEDPYTQRIEPDGNDAPPSTLPEEALKVQRRDKTPAAVRNSRLVLPPRRSEAATEKELAASDPSYTPATDAQELSEVSRLSAWWDEEGHWGEESQFRGFGASDKVVDRAVVEVYLRQAVVEVLALQQTGVLSEWATRKWRRGSRAELDQVLTAKIDVQDGRATLTGDVAAATTAIAQNLAPKDGEEDETQLSEDDRITAGEAREMVKTWDSAWHGLVLNDQMKFALRKRLYQITGNLVPDAKLGAAVTVKHLLTLASKQPPPKKLAELLGRRSDVHQLANVKVHSRKVGPVEKETAVGRWKVIEEELTKRGLPVLGTAGLTKHKELHWLKGKA